MSKINIYNKLRLSNVREGMYEEALIYGILHYLSWVQDLYRQKKQKEIKACSSKESLRKIQKRLLKQVNRQELTDRLTDYIHLQIQKLPDINFTRVKNELHKLFKKV